MTAGLLSLGGKVIGDVILENYNKRIINDIYYELPKHVHRVKISGEIQIDGGDVMEVGEYGCGIIFNNKFLTMAHVTNMNIVNDEKEGIIELKEEIKNKKVKLYEKELEEIVFDIDNDVAVYNLPSGLDIPNFPCNISGSDIKLGDEIYIIGNPDISGINIRRGYISDLDSIVNKADSSAKNCFGIDKVLIPGDSGTPIVNSNYDLLGLCAFSIRGSLGYVKKIEEFINY